MRTGGGFPDVVVTALASTTTLAPDAEGTWQRLLMGESGIRPLTKAFVEKYNAPAVPSTLTCMSFLSSFHHPFATIANPIGPAADYRAVLIHGR
jgi:3-oxoacyl-(acyl-carrier-protein) synthase